jgi:hypothetical protein
MIRFRGLVYAAAIAAAASCDNNRERECGQYRRKLPKMLLHNYPPEI